MKDLLEIVKQYLVMVILWFIIKIEDTLTRYREEKAPISYMKKPELIW
jgi:hypothetical protein